MSDTCLNCMGLIMEPGVVYGYSGKICHCPVNPAKQYQRPASKEIGKTVCQHGTPTENKCIICETEK